MNKLSFTSNNYEVVNNYEIFFNISIAETYSSVCKIVLTIKECYHSCKGCLHDKDSATEDNHGCINCKEEQGYYPSPEDSTNCFTKTYLENTYLNYYFDETLKIFKKCHDDCKRCNGPTDEDCLICNDEDLFLHNGKCISECPLETFESSDLEGKKCHDCYPNCETCNGLGNPENMKCSTCHGNQIKYRQNCLTKYDDKIKSFHYPVNFDIITSGYKLYGNYIIENTNECIDLIPSGYFISNLITGLLSPCHPKCLTCSKSFTAHNSNCDTCVGVLKLEEGNCVQSCSRGYYENNNICRKCHQNCLTCDAGMVKDSSEKLVNMNCNTCRILLLQERPNNNNEFEIFPGFRYLERQLPVETILSIPKMIKIEGNCFPTIIDDQSKIIFNISEIYPEEQNGTCLFFNKSIYAGKSECIDKPENTFYVLNNNENTGVIQNCSEACEACLGKYTTQNTNCIQCANGYFKTEDSDTNCITRDLIPKNYYFKTLDNIYYKCHPNCINCTNGYNQALDDMNCITCINDYYFIFEDNKNNCYNITIINKGYYLKNNLFYPCDENCLTCSDGKNKTSNNCITCDNENKSLYLVEGLNKCEYSNYSGYYLDNSINILKKCYDNCKTCKGPYEKNMNIENHNCLECADNYYNLPNGSFPNNCYDNATIDSWTIKCYYTCSSCKEIAFINGEGDLITQNCLS